MSETATKTPEKLNSAPTVPENSEKPPEPPAKTEVVTKKLEEVKLVEQNGVPASGDKKKTMTDDEKAFKDMFTAFSKFGDIKSDGKQISLSQSDKWMKQAKVIDGKTITTTDTGIQFKKFKALKISYNDFNKYLEDLAKTKKIDIKEIKTKMTTCGRPSVVEAAAGKATETVARLTDTTKYTGTHKERFNKEGKGKGKAGREDRADSSGYVSGYQNKNTYDKTH